MRHRARALRRRAGRRVLLHGRRSRAADRPQQGRRPTQRAQRQRDGGDGAGAAGQAHRQARSTPTPRRRTLQAAAGFMQQAPTAMGQMLLALIFSSARRTSWCSRATDDRGDCVAMCGGDICRTRCWPGRCHGDESPALLQNLLAGKTAAGGEPTLYVCEGFTCQRRRRRRGDCGGARSVDPRSLTGG